MDVSSHERKVYDTGNIPPIPWRLPAGGVTWQHRHKWGSSAAEVRGLLDTLAGIKQEDRAQCGHRSFYTTFTESKRRDRRFPYSNMALNPSR